MQPMTAEAITAITDFLLAAEAFFLAGRMTAKPKDRFSAAWYFCGVLLLLGTAALLGGIDHGFIRPANLPRNLIQRSDWIVLGGVTFCLLMTTAKQFFPPKWQRAAWIVAVVQFAGYAFAVLLADSFAVVVVNYSPIMLLLLTMNIIGLRSGLGSRQMIAGILILFLASGIQAAGINIFTPFDRNGLYHVVSMVGVAFMYLGGKRLTTK
jgi:hypothetical protein